MTLFVISSSTCEGQTDQSNLHQCFSAIQIAQVYNKMVKTRNLRRLAAIIIILISLIVLIWSIWPLDEVTKILPISPQDMQLPTPESFYPILKAIFFV